MKRLFYCFLLTICCACNEPTPANHKAELEQLADKTCRAIDIRKQRFLLADNIRFTQDTLLRTKSKSDSDRLQGRLKLYLEQKPILLKQSLDLADTIRMELDNLLPLTDKVAQDQFTKSLDSLLVLKGCKH
jgi:hypothetical protein